MHQLIINKTKDKAFDAFNEEYASIAIFLCPLLAKFSINVVSNLTSHYLNEMHYSPNDVFSYYLNKEGYDVSSTYAEIVVNLELCNRLSLSTQECFAAVAHEIGHIIMFFRYDKASCQGQAEEVYCDNYACRMGLSEPLYSLLHKLLVSDLYPELQNQQIMNRTLFIESYIQDL